jgi:NAD(P)H-dependent FMN reductase
MKIAIISGSHRLNSESDRIAAYVAKEVFLQGESPNIISLAGNPFPLWDEERWQESPRWDTAWGPTSAILKASEAFVFVVPEWGGMVPPGLKNFFLLCQSGELAHKPALIISLSAGINGSYPIAELRASSYKNTRICYLPDQVIVRTCQKMLLDGEDSNLRDVEIRERISYSLRLLREYAKALEGVRASGVADLVRFPFGM